MIRRLLRRHGAALALIALGGALGATLRYAVGALAGGALPMTVAVNALGSFALGLLLFDARADELLSKRLRYLFGTGFCASLTTYSTFVADAALAAPRVALLYILASYVTGFGGVLVSRAVVGALGDEPIRTPIWGGD